MDPIVRPAPFVLLATGHGTMIVPRLDYAIVSDGVGFGVGYQLFNQSLFDPGEVNLVLQLLELRRRHFGDGVMALDCGANIGVHTVEWARRMTGWGAVVGIEAQERLYYALAGNVALNNCMNAKVLHAAVGGEVGRIEIASPNYLIPGSFGSFEIRDRAGREHIGQDIDYQSGPKTATNLITIDSLNLDRLDFLKLDVEGMELEAFAGAINTLSAKKPIILAEVIKSKPGSIEDFLTKHGYRFGRQGLNLLAIHQDDPGMADITFSPG
ncbi:MAG TPA: FkbM family methyltransferase [Caulobacteraceae bacterium]|nr:FkbM family methyltransferase [Caulobacteraceae bacterium]